MNDIAKSFVSEGRLISEDSLKERLIRLVTSWEAILALLFILEFVFFSFNAPYFLDSFNLLNASFSYTEKSILALSMVFVIICGDIDISVASIIALSSLAIGWLASIGVESIWLLILAGIAVGALAGAFNGLLITMIGIPAIAITLGTQSLFRGICNIVLQNKAYTEFPEDFAYLGQGYISDNISFLQDIPFELVCYLILAVIIGFVLHYTGYGRKLYAIGNCTSTAIFSGIKVQRIRFYNFMLNGVFSGIVAVFLTSRIGSARPNMALNFEMESITLVVLGGVSILGGRGNIIGVLIASFLIGYLRYGMGIMKIPGKYMIITTGILLIGAVLLPGILDKIKEGRKLRRQQKEIDAERSGN